MRFTTAITITTTLRDTPQATASRIGIGTGSKDTGAMGTGGRIPGGIEPIGPIIDVIATTIDTTAIVVVITNAAIDPQPNPPP